MSNGGLRPYVVAGGTFGFKLTTRGLDEVRLPAQDAVTERTEDGRLVLDREAWQRGDFWADVHVEVDVWRDAHGALFCAGVSVRTVPGALRVSEMESQASTNNVLGPDVSAEVSARLWRQIPVGALIESVVDSIRAAPDYYADKLPADVLAAFEEDAARPRRGQRKPGPAPTLPDSMLVAVVAPAYLNAGRAPTQAVQRALSEAGFSNGHVTIDQARKAVVRARRKGLIPPSKRTRKAAP